MNTFDQSDNGHAIANGSRHVIRAPNGTFDPSKVPAPIINAGPCQWFMQNLQQRLTVSTKTDTSHNNIRWHTTYRTDDGHVFYDFVATWQSDADTLVIDETIHRDTDAILVIHPLGAHAATAYAYGAGRMNDPMQPLADSELSNVIGRLGHLSYFNQWQLAWAGFAEQKATAPFIGIFTGWARDWRSRGIMLHVGPIQQGHAAAVVGERPQKIHVRQFVEQGEHPPKDWQTVRIDLWALWEKPFEIRSLALRTVGGGAAFDQIVLAATEADLDALKK